MEAIGVFNQILKRCDEFPTDRAAAERFICNKRQLMQGEGVQTQATLEVQERSEQQLENIEQLSQQIYKNNNLNSDGYQGLSGVKEVCNWNNPSQ